MMICPERMGLHFLSSRSARGFVEGNSVIVFHTGMGVFHTGVPPNVLWKIQISCTRWYLAITRSCGVPKRLFADS